jgi:hypothetical protein
MTWEDVGGGPFADLSRGVEKHSFLEAPPFRVLKRDQVFRVGGAFQPGKRRPFIPQPRREVDGRGERRIRGRHRRHPDDVIRAEREIVNQSAAAGDCEPEPRAAAGQAVQLDQLGHGLRQV